MNAGNGKGYGTPLRQAALRGHRDVARELIKRGADIHGTNDEGVDALNSAAGSGDIEIVKMLVDLGMDVNKGNEAKIKLENHDYNVTPLMKASAGGHVPVIQELLKRGALLELQSLHGRATALHFAVLFNREAAVELLLRAGADPTKKDRTGMTPLEVARSRNFSNIVALLEKHRPQ